MLGTALIFWGVMTGHLISALLLFLVVESAHWFRLRWNFDETAQIRAWQLSVLACGATAIYFWLEESRFDALQRMLVWLPALFLPVQLAQSFGLRDSMPVSAFSFFARQRQLRNRRLGLKDSSASVNFGNVYLVSCIVSATLGKEGPPQLFLPGILALLAWALLASRQTRWLPLLVAIAITGTFAYLGQYGLAYAHERAWTMFSRGGGRSGTDSDVSKTAIGALREVKLSPEIKWRLKPLDGSKPPRLVRTAGYNRYSSGDWSNDKTAGLAKDADFADLDPIEIKGGPYYLLREDIEQDVSALAKLPRFNLRGQANLDSQLPVPGDAAGVRGFRFDNMERNSLGTVRIAPSEGVIDGVVFWKGDVQPETPPTETADRFVPKPEREALAVIAQELGLAEEPTVEGKIKRIDQFFREKFTYTRYLTIPPEDAQSQTAMSAFLLHERKGHCEYFATAAALLLRQAGVPTRYAIGFVVTELDTGRKEFVLRGEHGHAWCRAWDAESGKWIDFDATPPGWFSLERRPVSSMRWLTDWYLRVREDFTVWRSRPANRIGVAIGMFAIGIGAAIVIGRRLWRSKHMVGGTAVAAAPAGDPPPRTPLHDLEAPAMVVLGPRPPGLTFSRWLLGLTASGADPGVLQEAIELHQRLRYDPAPVETPLIERLRTLSAGIAASIRTDRKR